MAISLLPIFCARYSTIFYGLSYSILEICVAIVTMISLCPSSQEKSYGKAYLILNFSPETSFVIFCHPPVVNLVMHITFFNDNIDIPKRKVSYSIIINSFRCRHKSNMLWPRPPGDRPAPPIRENDPSSGIWERTGTDAAEYRDPRRPASAPAPGSHPHCRFLPEPAGYCSLLMRSLYQKAAFCGSAWHCCSAAFSPLRTNPS